MNPAQWTIVPEAALLVWRGCWGAFSHYYDYYCYYYYHHDCIVVLNVAIVPVIIVVKYES